MNWSRYYRLPVLLLLGVLLLSACMPDVPPADAGLDLPTATPAPQITPTPLVTPLPTREPFLPGELVDYTVQSNDTLDLLAQRFNTTVEEIRTANPVIPQDVTFLPPGMPMKIPIYYLPLWGSPYHILPDELFVNGPAQDGFDAQKFIDAHPGWLKGYHEWADGAMLNAGQIIDRVMLDYSVSPRLLLALVEYEAGGLSQPAPADGYPKYPLGYEKDGYAGLYMQLVWTANYLNNLYYGVLDGKVTTFDHLDGTMERPDPWQNAATVALQLYFAGRVSGDDYTRAISPVGFAQVYQGLFGEIPKDLQPLIPGNLRQPAFELPFQPGKTWAFTGGPHTGWGEGAPLAAIDFAPPSGVSGCVESEEWATAVAPGVIARVEEGLVVLDLDGDGNERTGWTALYLHNIPAPGIVLGKKVNTGDIIGHPSCERGRATGTHIHIARKYNGEWLSAAGTVPFNLEGWVAYGGATEYEGTLTKFGRTKTACQCSDANSQIRIGE